MGKKDENSALFLPLRHVWAGPELSLIKICSVNRNPPTTFTPIVTRVSRVGLMYTSKPIVLPSPWHEKFRGFLSSATRHGFRKRFHSWCFFFFSRCCQLSANRPTCRQQKLLGAYSTCVSSGLYPKRKRPNDLFFFKYGKKCHCFSLSPLGLATITSFNEI